MEMFTILSFISSHVLQCFVITEQGPRSSLLVNQHQLKSAGTVGQTVQIGNPLL